MKHVSRRTVLVGAGLVGLLSAGCMTKPMQPPNPDGTYCFATGKWHSRKLTCTPTPIPPESVEVEAKRFEPAPGLLTVYVVRKRWGDTVNPVQLRVDGGPPVLSLLRYGLRSWGGDGTCLADWNTSQNRGRICLTNTRSPFYAGWTIGEGNYCSESNQSYGSTACSAARRFTIGVR